MTSRLTVSWPDDELFRGRGGRPVRILAVSDEPDPALDSSRTRQAMGEVDIVVGCGDLQPSYLGFVTDAFQAPLVYVRGNHDVGAAWEHSERRMLPDPLDDGVVHVEQGLPIIGFSGSPRYNQDMLQLSATQMWLRVVLGRLRLRVDRPLLVLSHAAPRGLGDADDHAHRGFTAFRWLAGQLRPPLWLHGHTALVRRGLDDRSVRSDGTLFYNCTGASIVELVPPDQEVT